MMWNSAEKNVLKLSFVPEMNATTYETNFCFISVSTKLARKKKFIDSASGLRVFQFRGCSLPSTRKQPTMSMMVKCKQSTQLRAFINKLSYSIGILENVLISVFVSWTRKFCADSHKKRTSKLVCVQNESVIKLLCCAHVSCLALLFILASFVFEMVSKRWMNGGFMCSQKAMLLIFFGFANYSAV